MKDYYQFLEDFDTYNEWNNIQKKDAEDYGKFFKDYGAGQPVNEFPEDTLSFHSARSGRNLPSLGNVIFDDRVNSPSHYTSGKTEVIDIIEDAVQHAPSNIYGMLQGQVLKYMLRVWLKDNPLEDLKKAQWYLTRLIEHYENPPGD